MIFEKEKKDIKEVLRIAEEWGYGNVIVLLKRAWMEKLKEWGLDEAAALEAVSGHSPYSIDVFKRFKNDK